MIEVVDLTKRYAGRTAVNGISFSVARGEIVGLLGPNGAGKSTIFNLVTGYLPLTSGSISFNGAPIDRLPTTRIAQSGIARAFQIAKPFPDLSVADNVRIGALFGRTGPRDVAAETGRALELTGLDALAGRRAGELTVGFLRRLELARAIATRPVLLLADEPCAGLNPTETEEIITILRVIRERGVTVLLVEHDMQAVMRVSDRVFVLDAGNLIAAGTPAAVSRDPAVIAAYLGSEVDAPPNG